MFNDMFRNYRVDEEFFFLIFLLFKYIRYSLFSILFVIDY